MDAINNQRRRNFNHLQWQSCSQFKDGEKIEIVQIVIIGMYGRFDEINHTIIYGMRNLHTMHWTNCTRRLICSLCRESRELKNSESCSGSVYYFVPCLKYWRKKFLFRRRTIVNAKNWNRIDRGYTLSIC